jgi:predicted secreted protein
MKTIEQRWREFSERVIPRDAPQVQHQEMRRAFYAGFTSMLEVDEELARMTDEAAIILLDSFYREAMNYRDAAVIISLVRA